MKTFPELLIELRACGEARDFAANKSYKEVIETCHRGDWLLWIASKLNLPLQPITLAKARSAKTVFHLMKDERSRQAVLIAERFGLGLASKEELDAAAAYAAYAAADAAAYAAADAADAAAYAAYAAAAAADAADAAADAAAGAARPANQLETATICREILGELLLEAIENKLNETI